MNDLKLDLNIYSIWYEPFFRSKNFWIIILSLSLIVIGIFFIYFFKRRKKYIKPITVNDLINEIDLLQNAVYSIDSKKIYCELILIIKKFIEINYKSNQYSKTESELIKFLEAEEVAQNVRREANDLINCAQLIKFSQYEVSKNTIVENLQKAKELFIILNKTYVEDINNKTT